jgi:hypothetical protein
VAGKFPSSLGPVCPIDQAEERKMLYSMLFLMAVMEQKVSGFQRMVAGDVSWFFLYYSRPWVWAAVRHELPHRIRQKSDMERCFASIFWSLNAIHNLLDVRKGTACNATFFTDAVIPNLPENVRSRTHRKILKN